MNFKKVLCAATAMILVSMVSVIGVGAAQDSGEPDVSQVSENQEFSVGSEVSEEPEISDVSVTEPDTSEESEISEEPEISQVSGDVQESSEEEIQPLKAEIKISARKIYEGDTAKVSVTPEGGSGNYTYSCTVQNLATEEIEFSETSEEPEFMVRFESPEKYLVTVSVYDESEQEITVEKNVTIGKALPFIEKSITADKNKALPGGKITVNANVSGGKKPYSYKCTLKDAETGKTVYSSGFSTESMNIKLPEGDPKFYQIDVRITDMKNNVVSKTISVASYKASSSPLSLSGSKISELHLNMRKDLTLTANATGGIAPYRYKAFYKDEAGRWKECTSYQYSPVMKFKLPPTEGKYKVKIAAVDLNGRCAEKEFSVDVRKFTLDNSFLASKKYYTGNNVNFISVAQFANGAVKYRYSYRVEGGVWNYEGAFSGDTNHYFKFNYSGKYEIRVNAKDSSGNSAEKKFVINVQEKDITGDRGLFINTARTYLGKDGDYVCVKKLGMPYVVDWCAYSVSSIMNDCGFIGKYQGGIYGYASDNARLDNGIYGEWFLKGTKAPQAGDLIMFRYKSFINPIDKYSASHIGIVESVDGNTITTLEGNVDATGYNWAATSTYKRKTYDLDEYYIYSFFRPNWKLKG